MEARRLLWRGRAATARPSLTATGSTTWREARKLHLNRTKRTAGRKVRAASLAAALVAVAVLWGAPFSSSSGGDSDPAGANRTPENAGDQDAPALARCAPVDTRGAFVTGGCRARARSLEVEFRIRTVFGTMPFGVCGVDFDLSIAEDGRVWLDDIRIGGPAPCSDLWPCAGPKAHAKRKSRLTPPPRALVPPWRGQLVALDGGGFEGSFRLCVDTCAGRYAGPVRFEIRDSDDGWALRTLGGGVGTGGLLVAAEWRLTGDILRGLSRRG